MERLTERNPSWIDDEMWERACEPDCEEIDAVYRKLKAYEDAEEQGLLLKLPCKVGDTIYEVSYENRKYIICEHIVNQFVYISYRKPRIEIYCEGENGFLSSSITGQLDDGLFLNREEAEAKLKELRGVEND
jgi:hypothetical protein